jgi:hypothetical protein
MEGPFDENHISEGIKKVKEKKKTLTTEKAVLLNDLINVLENLRNKTNQ